MRIIEPLPDPEEKKKKEANTASSSVCLVIIHKWCPQEEFEELQILWTKITVSMLPEMRTKEIEGDPKILQTSFTDGPPACLSVRLGIHLILFPLSSLRENMLFERARVGTKLENFLAAAAEEGLRPLQPSRVDKAGTIHKWCLGLASKAVIIRTVCTDSVQGLVKKWTWCLANFIPVVAHHFCLNLPEIISQPLSHFYPSPLLQKSNMRTNGFGVQNLTSFLYGSPGRAASERAELIHA